LGQAIANKTISEGAETSDQLSLDVRKNLIDKIKEKEAKGEEAQNLRNLLQENESSFAISAANRENLLNQEGITGKQIVGDALQLATTAAGGKVAKDIRTSYRCYSVVKGLYKGLKRVLWQVEL
jgi:hypothetical protein